jgi:2'-5' RNA ligase
VGALRAVHDPSAADGAPAHVTLLFPFRAAEQIDDAAIARVQAIAADARPFDFTLARIGRFDGTLYLAPEPAAPFVALTRALAAAYPEHPPYGGLHADVVPHLTVARGDAAVLDRVAATLGMSWPGAGIAARAGDIVLIANHTGRWRTLHRFPLLRGGTTIGGGIHRHSRREGEEA